MVLVVVVLRLALVLVLVLVVSGIGVLDDSGAILVFARVVLALVLGDEISVAVRGCYTLVTPDMREGAPLFHGMRWERSQASQPKPKNI